MIITAKTPLRTLVNLAITALGWLIFLTLFGLGFMEFFTAETSGPDAPFLPAELRASLGTLLSYTAMMLILALIIIAWFQYNELFGKYSRYGRYRRQNIVPTTPEQLRQSLGVSCIQFDIAQTGKIIIIHHNKGGTILDVV